MGTVLLIVALVEAALVLLALEVLTPSFGVLAAAAVAALVGAVWVAFRFSALLGTGLLVGVIVGVPAYLVMLVRVLPGSSLGRGLFLRKADVPAEGEGTPEVQDYAALVGREGVAETLLRPSGAVRIDGRRVIASAESGVIRKGARVRVIRAGGMNVVVREVEASS